MAGRPRREPTKAEINELITHALQVVLDDHCGGRVLDLDSRVRWSFDQRKGSQGHRARITFEWYHSQRQKNFSGPVFYVSKADWAQLRTPQLQYPVLVMLEMNRGLRFLFSQCESHFIRFERMARPEGYEGPDQVQLVLRPAKDLTRKLAYQPEHASRKRFTLRCWGSHSMDTKVDQKKRDRKEKEDGLFWDVTSNCEIWPDSLTTEVYLWTRVTVLTEDGKVPAPPKTTSEESAPRQREGASRLSWHPYERDGG